MRVEISRLPTEHRAEHRAEHVALERAEEPPKQSAGGKFRRIIPPAGPPAR
ncbi:hypothetical protein [Nonomuraea indica]|uniref:Uncharacterized protein n=1 Tax=Nonomuraea indica TaxID=1581193 RepID=A0ABW8A840_9ACTN